MSRIPLSKRRAINLALLCVVLSVLFTVWFLPPCLLGSVLLGLIFGGIWLAKHERDFQYIIAAKADAEQALLAPPAPPLMTTPGSQRLFVPPPLDRR